MEQAVHQPITIEPAVNGVVMAADGRRLVYELKPGRRAKAMHDLLKEVATSLAGGLDVRIEVRDPDGAEVPVLQKPPKKFLTQSDVEAEYSISTKTLEDWRSNGKGPQYSKTGKRVYYQREDVESFMRSNVIRTTGRV